MQVLSAPLVLSPLCGAAPWPPSAAFAAFVFFRRVTSGHCKCHPGRDRGSPLQPLPEGNTRSPDEKFGCKPQGEQSSVRNNRAWEPGERGELSVIIIHQQHQLCRDFKNILNRPQRPCQMPALEIEGFPVLLHVQTLSPDVLVSLELHKQLRVFPRWHSFIL